MIGNKNKIFDYFSVFLLIGISAFPFFRVYNDHILIFFMIVLLWVYIKRNKKIRYEVQFIWLNLIFIFLVVMQILTFNVFPVATIVGLFVKIFTAYLVVKNVGREYINIFIKIMYFLSIVSFIFWIPVNMSNGIKNFLVSNAPFHPEGFANGNYILYHMNIFTVRTALMRNCGPFWEPGVFGGFLLIALVFSYFKRPKLRTYKNGILFAGVLSTLSTTSYIAVVVFFVSHALINFKNISTTVLCIFILILSLYAYVELPFLGDKIEYEITRISKIRSYEIHRTRLTSALVDFKDFMENPLIGRGKFQETRFVEDDVAKNRNNGTTDFLVIFGIFGFSTYFYSYYISLKNYLRFHNNNNKYALFFVPFVWLLGFSENYFLLPVFWGFCFLGYCYARKKVYIRL